jgi:hypothetical protein
MKLIVILLILSSFPSSMIVLQFGFMLEFPLLTQVHITKILCNFGGIHVSTCL